MSITIPPIRKPTFFSQQINQTLGATSNVATKSGKIETAVQLTVTVPKTADFGLYFQYNNFYTAQQKTLVDWKDNGDNTKTAVYAVSKKKRQLHMASDRPQRSICHQSFYWLNSMEKDTVCSFDFANGQTNKLSA